MRIYIVIPAHNEETHLGKTLESLLTQSHPASKIVVVDDGSTDSTPEVIQKYESKHRVVEGTGIFSEEGHLPGGKVIRAFNRGLEVLDDEYDIVCKFDADLVFPPDYLEGLVGLFGSNPRCGLAGGICAIKKDQNWVPESLTSKDHLRGALKAYRKDCFVDIGGLRPRMGWDTLDEMLARYCGWQVCTSASLLVKHLKPTGERYSGKLARLQGSVFRDLRYGLVLALFAAAKLAVKKRSPGFFFVCIGGYISGPADYLVDRDQGRFLRRYRWRKIIGK